MINSTIDLNICKNNCSGHGECFSGKCFCEVEFSGRSCDNPNLNYYITFSTIFFILCIISFIQLLLCINSEFSRKNPKSISKALKITTQKALYVLICLATAIRGFYFQSSFNESLKWASDLKSAYYPVLLSGFSLVVCFWAEAFHLHEFSTERPRFLSKSFCGFILFNIITYSLFFVELVLIKYLEINDLKKNLFFNIFDIIYAAIMLIVAIFFLIYGIKVYVKLKGAFAEEEFLISDESQLNQSRFGLISQATLLIITVLFILSDVLGSFWKRKVPVISRNTYQVTFQIVELAIALWFPCCLWNCIQPEQLWILNPKRLFKKSILNKHISLNESNKKLNHKEKDSFLLNNNSIINQITSKNKIECWICYDSYKKDILIQPCKCKGDISIVHHECLKIWLMESNSSTKNIRCKICNELYKLDKREIWLLDGFELNHYLKCFTLIFIMIMTIILAYFINNSYNYNYIRTIVVGISILIEYICFKILGFNLLSAYHKAKFLSIIIGGKIIENDNNNHSF